MIGFEAELQVPTFRRESWPQGVNDAYSFDIGDDIYSFLFCGYENPKTVVSWSERFLKIKPDVADYAEEGKLLFVALSDFLQIEKENRFLKEPRMTKLEYETFPIDESAANSNETYKAQAASIRDHAAKFASEAQNEIVEVPDTRVKTEDDNATTEGTSETSGTGLIGLELDGMYAGVPVKGIEGTIALVIAGDKSQAKAPAINELLQKIRAKVKPKFAIQATAGIFPSVIPQLFENPQKPLDQPFTPGLREAWEIAYPLICKSVQLIMHDAKFENDEWVKTNLSGEPRRDAFKGHLYLLCSYLVGDALSQTEPFKKMSVKNAVPYHAKLNLGYFYKALPQRGSETPVELACWIAKALVDQEYVKPEFWSKRGLPPFQDRSSDRQERLIYGDPVNFVSNAITGKPVRTVINQRGHEKIEGEHYEPDSAPLSKHGERGVQLEFRRLGAEGVSLDGLEAVFMNVVNEVRKVNGAYAG